MPSLCVAVTSVLLLAAAAAAQSPCQGHDDLVCIPAGWFDKPSWGPSTIANDSQLEAFGNNYIAPILYGGLGTNTPLYRGSCLQLSC